ncbi:hypothetical protein [Flavobacterium sp. WC2509]|uniref:hypothetical protein n=1 Tax=Flavobacterium sp. WC2509 TaxID=3461406 RepID=UPI00404399C1
MAQHKIVIFLAAIMLSSCDYRGENSVKFKSDFEDIETGSLAGSEYLPVPLNDWKVSDNRVECLVSNKNRNLQLLTRELGTHEGTLEMTVRVGFFNQSLSSRNDNWAGFSIGSKDKKKYNGVKIGVCTNGALFIGEPSPNDKNIEVINSLAKGLDLKIVVTPIENNYTIDFSTIDISTGQVLANISKTHVPKNWLMGELLLTSNFENTETDKTNTQKSVWFEDWEIKGTKVNNTEKKTSI